jgi:hypothetical protein
VREVDEAVEDRRGESWVGLRVANEADVMASVWT